MLDSKPIKTFMNTFFGYGNLSSPYWFVGMEEGGGNTEKEITQRLARWHKLGNPTTTDNLCFHQAVQDATGQPMTQFFGEHPKIQRTWGRLIRVLLAIDCATDCTPEDVRKVQAENWGRMDADNCLLELFPLPSPRISQWKFSQWTTLSELQSRKEYKAAFEQSRTDSLASMVRQHGPRVVIFYSTSKEYLHTWSKVAGVDFQATDLEQMCLGNQGQPLTARFSRRHKTLFVVVSHPACRGLTNKYFTSVGHNIRARLG